MVKFRYRVLALLVPCASFLFAAANLRAADFYVTHNGSPSGSGSLGSPWDLQTALNQPSSVHPGDTIWLRGGTYVGHYTSNLNGTSANPILVRQYAGEHATIDGNYGGNLSTLIVNGSYTWFWGFEVTNSDPNRWSNDGEDPPRRGEGIEFGGPGTRLINLIIHDTSQGILATAGTTEITGNLIYYNGYDASDRGHGHAIYAQNQGSTSKPFYDNIMFEQFGYGIHAYSEGGYLDNLDFEGNTSFDNGGLSNVSGWTTNILVGGLTHVATSPKILNNYTYNRDHVSNNNLGYSAGCSNPTVTGNYLDMGTALKLISCTGSTMTGNTFYGTISGFTQGQFPNNTYYSSRPTGTKVFVRPNAYESGRANITVYNWDLNNTVSVNVSGILSPGDGYEVRNAADFFGAPVLMGTYNGSPLSLPMTNLSVATPVGVAAPSPTGPEFNVFVLLPASSNGTPTPTPVSSATPTRTRTPTPPAGTATRTPTRTSTPTASPTSTVGLPAPWIDQDIGAVGLSGSASYLAGTFTDIASGADIWGTADAFHYVYRLISGDTTIVARASFLQNTDPWAKGGVMIRESLAAGAKNAFMAVTPGNGLRFQRRLSTGGGGVTTAGGAGIAPYWVKLVRAGNTLTAYKSTNGTGWVVVGSDTIAMSGSVYVGLAVSSHNNTLRCTSTFTNVSVTTP